MWFIWSMGEEHSSPPWHSHPPYFHKTGTPPRTRSAVCSQFPALTFCFGCFTFSELCGDNSCSPSLPAFPSIPAGTSQGDSIHHLSAITYHLLTAVSEQGVFNKSHFHFQERDLELYVCALCTHTCMFAQNLGYCASVFIHSLSTYTSTIRLVLVTSLSAVSLLDLHVCLHRLLFASLAWSILSRNGFLH